MPDQPLHCPFPVLRTAQAGSRNHRGGGTPDERANFCIGRTEVHWLLPRRRILPSAPPNRPLELKPHRTRGRPPRKAGPNHKHNPKSQVGGVTLMLTAAFLRFKLGTPRQRQKRNSRLASSASWDERVRTPLIYFPLKLRLWRGGHIEGGDPMGWNQVWWWLEWISTVGQGERGGCHGGGGERDAGWVSSKNAECPQTTQPPRQRQLADRRLPNSHEAPSAPRVSLAPL